MGAFEDVEDEKGFCRWNWGRLILWFFDCHSLDKLRFLVLLLEFSRTQFLGQQEKYGKLDGVRDIRLKTLPVIVTGSKRNRSVRSY
jgi:hypothetical protein